MSRRNSSRSRLTRGHAYSDGGCAAPGGVDCVRIIFRIARTLCNLTSVTDETGPEGKVVVFAALLLIALPFLGVRPRHRQAKGGHDLPDLKIPVARGNRSNTRDYLSVRQPGNKPDREPCHCCNLSCSYQFCAHFSTSSILAVNRSSVGNIDFAPKSDRRFLNRS